MLPYKLLAPFTKPAQSGAKNTHFANFFVTKTMHRFTDYPADHFREILTQNVNCCRRENFWNKISKLFWKGVIFPEKPHF